MKMFVVRLNPDTRSFLPYSKYPTSEEYDQIHKSSPMDGFHEAVNFLPEKGVIRGYLPPRHLVSMRTGEPFFLVSITAKTAKIGGDQIVGIQAGCRYEGESARRGGSLITQSLGLTWHYSCPESLSLLLDNPARDARSIVLGKNGSWLRGPTLKINKSSRGRILKAIASRIKTSDARKKLKLILASEGRATELTETMLDAESTFEAEIELALNTNLDIVIGKKYPGQKEIRSFQYERDPRVVAYALKRAKGVCNDCRGKMPFDSKITGFPYLEVHHVEMLREGGSDTIDNVIAVCPNCHRARHHGYPIFL